MLLHREKELKQTMEESVQNQCKTYKYMKEILMKSLYNMGEEYLSVSGHLLSQIEVFEAGTGLHPIELQTKGVPQ